MSEQEDQTAPRRTVDVYDFRRPTTLPRQHSRVLEVAFETFARQWGTQLTAKVRVKSTVTLEQLIMQSYDEYASSLPSASAPGSAKTPHAKPTPLTPTPAHARRVFPDARAGLAGFFLTLAHITPVFP
ncbi:MULTISPECIES: hypothetical protein [Arthrobacter]|uniref:hypothetical protein n=1 Tax=Arthrobacter TaxID=1663 RepID=UPI001F19960A|nr:MULTISPECIES: hypothetical protein [Arthrobacter]